MNISENYATSSNGFNTPHSIKGELFHLNQQLHSKQQELTQANLDVTMRTTTKKDEQEPARIDILEKNKIDVLV
jgi:hypothetical protein